jgi:hypothetical protein
LDGYLELLVYQCYGLTAWLEYWILICSSEIRWFNHSNNIIILLVCLFVTLKNSQYWIWYQYKHTCI